MQSWNLRAIEAPGGSRSPSVLLSEDEARAVLLALEPGQELIPLLSDPFGRGWDLFGTASWSPDVRLVGSRSPGTARWAPSLPGT